MLPLRRFSSGSSMIFWTTKQMPAKLPMATAAPTRLPRTTVSSNFTQPTRCSAAKSTHMIAVQNAVPPAMRSSSFLDSGCNFIDAALPYHKCELKPVRRGLSFLERSSRSLTKTQKFCAPAASPSSTAGRYTHMGQPQWLTAHQQPPDTSPAAAAYSAPAGSARPGLPVPCTSPSRSGSPPSVCAPGRSVFFARSAR